MKTWKNLTVLALVAVLVLAGCGKPDPDKTFTVTFDADNGSTPATQTVPEGGKAAKPADPVNDGYTFDHWFNVATTAEWDFNTAITANITLKAKWTPIEEDVCPCDPKAHLGIDEPCDCGDANCDCILQDYRPDGFPIPVYVYVYRTGAGIDMTTAIDNITAAYNSDSFNDYKPLLSNKVEKIIIVLGTGANHYEENGKWVLEFGVDRPMAGIRSSMMSAIRAPVETVATPTATPPEGTYTGTQTVTLTCTTAGADIYYTLDGTPPTASSTKYATAISISDNATLKAIAVKSGWNNSDILTAVYMFEPANKGLFETGVLFQDASGEIGITAFIKDERVNGGSQNLQEMGIVTQIENAIKGIFGNTSAQNQGRFRNVFGVSGGVTIIVNNPTTPYKLKATEATIIYIHIDYLLSEPDDIQQNILDVVRRMAGSDGGLPIEIL